MGAAGQAGGAAHCCNTMRGSCAKPLGCRGAAPELLSRKKSCQAICKIQASARLRVTFSLKAAALVWKSEQTKPNKSLPAVPTMAISNAQGHSKWQWRGFSVPSATIACSINLLPRNLLPFACRLSVCSLPIPYINGFPPPQYQERG